MLAKMIDTLLEQCIAENRCCIVITKANDDNDDGLIRINSNMDAHAIQQALRCVVENTKPVRIN